MWNGTPLTEIARAINLTVRGWVNYYGRFYPSRLADSLRRIDEYLVRWAMKHKRLRHRRNRAWSSWQTCTHASQSFSLTGKW